MIFLRRVDIQCRDAQLVTKRLDMHVLPLFFFTQHAVVKAREAFSSDR